MRGLYVSEPALAIPDNDASGVEAQLLVYGLATVDMDVRVDLLISHPRIADLRVTLVNPAGTEVTVFDGSSDGPELALAGEAIAGFPGDESVNGVWRLRVADVAAGETGVVGTFGLTITSRWD
jgi:serine protease